MTESELSRLQHLAARVATDPVFLAHAIAAYQTRHGITDDALAAELKCDAEQLVRLRLCACVRVEMCAADVQRIADGIGCDSAALSRIALGE